MTIKYNSDLPLHLVAAYQLRDMREVPGIERDPKITIAMHMAGHMTIEDDQDYSWVAPFVHHVLLRAGHTMGFGRNVAELLEQSPLSPVSDAPRVGDIALFGDQIGFVIELFDDSVRVLFGDLADASGRYAVGAETKQTSTGLYYRLTEKTQIPVLPTVTLNNNRVATWAGLPGAIDETTRKHYCFGDLWIGSNADLLPAGTDYLHYLVAAKHGKTAAAFALQQAVGAYADGHIGPRTLEKVALADAEKLLHRYADQYAALEAGAAAVNGAKNGVTNEDLAAAAKQIQRDVNAAEELLKASDEHGKPRIFETTSGGETSKRPDMQGEVITATPPKWWAKSKTVWGAIVSAVAVLGPVLFPALQSLGVPIDASVFAAIDAFVQTGFQAIAGLIGAGLTVWGRLDAKSPLRRSDPVTLRF